MERQPDLAKTTDLELRGYSLTAELAMIIGSVLFARQLKRGHGDVEEVGDFLAYAVPGVLLVARLAHATFYDLDRSLADPIWVLKFWGAAWPATVRYLGGGSPCIGSRVDARLLSSMAATGSHSQSRSEPFFSLGQPTQLRDRRQSGAGPELGHSFSVV